MAKPNWKESPKKNREFLNWVTLHTCVACGHPGELHDDGKYHVAPAHLKTRGAGGEDIGNVIPLCYGCHYEQHQVGWDRFEKIYDLNSQKLAQDFEKMWEHTRT